MYYRNKVVVWIGVYVLVLIVLPLVMVGSEHLDLELLNGIGE